MVHTLGRLRLAALNIDGVLLNDTFSPVIHRFLVDRGCDYTAELERSIFSQPRAVAGRLLAEAIGGSLTPQAALDLYFRERARYLETHPVRLNEGAVELLRRLRAAGLRTVSYGGLGKEHFDTFLGVHADLFDGPGYICTDTIRPGIHEIVTEYFGLTYDEAVFVDDVANVGRAARELGVPFIGHPSDFRHSFQPRLMREAGVRHIVGSLCEIDERLLRTVDEEAALGTVWKD
ncbi:HAD family phosphatase [Streptomyces sp. NPDC100445]|uniref:HAD family phosphatase n=1 Tax=Streptomyces sp. NPDC100445 TaxID=3366102 RepID=UPI0037F3DC8F